MENALRPTFAYLDDIVHRSKAAAEMLDVAENTLRNHLKDCGFEIQRANKKNPSSPAIRQFSIHDVFRLADWRRTQGLVKQMPSGPTVIAVDLIKGGVGKSTTAAEVGVQLSLRGYRVLLIDLDVQSNLTQLLGYESDLTIEEAAEHGLTEEAIVHGTFASICTDYMDCKAKRKPKPSDMSHVIKKPFGNFGPSLIPSDTFFGDLEMAFSYAKGNRELVFRELLKDSAAGFIPGFNVSEFDFIIFDCPPNISFSSTNAIAAADVVVAPIKMESFAMKGLSRLVQEINGLSERSPEIKPELVILPTSYSRNISRVSRMQMHLQAYKHALCPTVISISEKFPKSQESYLPLTLQHPTSDSVKEYRMFTEHLLQTCLKLKKKVTPHKEAA